MLSIKDTLPSPTVGFQRVGQLSLNDSLTLLGKIIYGTTIVRHDDGMEESKKMVETLGLHALAIVQAGAVIRETSCSLHGYLIIYQRREEELLLRLPTHLGTDYQ